MYGSPVFGISLWGTGDNLTGDLGDGSGTTRYRPVEVLSSGVTAIAAGGGFSLFIESDGSLWAMGTDLSGQLGDGNSGQFAEALSPEKIVSANVTAIAAGYSHSLFIKSDGSLWAMGYNNDGELADGSANNSVFPERIVPPRQLVISQINLSGTNLVLHGTDDFSGGSAIVWSSTNMATPLNQWTPIWTNGLGSGNFSFTVTNAVNASVPRRFFRLELFQIQ